MTRKEAYIILKDIRMLRTDILEPLNISFETFLSQTNFTDAHIDKCIDKLIKHLDKEFKNN